MKKFQTTRIITCVFSVFILGIAGTAADRSTSARDPAARPVSAARIDLNTADQQTLETLPGVGPQTAQAIIAARPFTSVNDLEAVSGIGPAKMKELKGLVTISRPTKQNNAGVTRNGGTRAPPSAVRGSQSAGPGDTGQSTGVTSFQHRIDLNTATRAELEALPEIGPVKAQAIIEARPFSSIEDVMRVKGIKEQTFAAIRDRITVR
jgi:competence protein ComEA